MSNKDISQANTRPCKECGSTEKYSNGGCKPCQRKEQAVRNKKDSNRKYAVQKRKIREANKRARDEAAMKGQSKYETIDSCDVCNTKLRYTSRDNCVDCNYLGAPENPENKPGQWVKQKGAK